MTNDTVQAPTPAQLKELADDLGFGMSEADLTAFGELMGPSIDAYNAVDRMAQELPPVKYPRTPGHRPSDQENPHGAWYVRTTIEGARDGKLKGKTIAIKDNVCIAGVPMMNGASTLEGYVPDVDATIVTRILDAGGTILGKAVCEYFCFSGGSHTSASGPVHNPHRRGHSAGRLVLGQRGADRRRRGRHGDRRRSGRLDPHSRLVLRHLRHEADPRPGAVHRGHADRADHRPHRADDRDGRRQRAAARGAGGA